MTPPISRPANLTANVDESTAARIRDRALDRLSHAESPVSAAEKLIEGARPEELGVILQEIPSWLESRGHPTNFVDKVVARVRPDVAEAAERARKAAQVKQIGHQTISQVRTGIRNGTPVTHLMTAEQVKLYDPDYQ